MSIAVWFLGFILFWVVARFTIMKYEDLNSWELVGLVIFSIAPYVNYIMTGILILATMLHVLQRNMGSLQWVDQKFVWKKSPYSKKDHS